MGKYLWQAALLLLLSSGLWAEEKTGEINPYGTKTKEARAVEAAIAFLDECGSSYTATIKSKYASGELHWTDAGTSRAGYDDEIYIDKWFFRHELDFKNSAHLEEIASLARSLVHESRHVDAQSRVYRFGSYLAEGPVLPGPDDPWYKSFYTLFFSFQNGAEIDAYSATVIEMDHWINCRFKAARGFAEIGETDIARYYYCQLETLISLKQDYITDIRALNNSTDGKFPLAIVLDDDTPVTYQMYLDALDRMEEEARTEKDALPPPPTPPVPAPAPAPVTTPGTPGPVPPSPGQEKNQDNPPRKVSRTEFEEAKKRGKGPSFQTEVVEPPNGCGPEDCEFVWRGRGQNTGEVLELELINKTQREATVEFIPGLVLEPPAGSTFQAVMIGEVRRLVVPAGGSIRASLRGYCLDEKAEAPPAGQVIEYQPVLDRSGRSLQVLSLLAGRALAKRSELGNDLGGRHLETVIQRAIWTIQNPTKHTRQQLLDDILAQVKATDGKQTQEQVEELTDHLWQDIQKVLELARRAPALNNPGCRVEGGS
ncbi:MAG: hypothetical protein KC910_04760 [Candidatus Eremiobacteraeota bacterium]|nr:hypothetical protein [Candidatus Eremiobacteraeota bacterium]